MVRFGGPFTLFPRKPAIDGPGPEEEVRPTGLRNIADDDRQSAGLASG
jgi:hypothetical protein